MPSDRSSPSFVSFVARSIAGLVLAASLSVPAQADLPDVYRALASNDCAAIGDGVNRGLDREDPEAYYFAGFLYDDTECVADDPVRAARFYQRAVDGGYVEARDALGRLHALGRGVPQDYVAAYRWYARDPADPLLADPSRAAGAGYAITVARLARVRARYPLIQQQSGIEATLDAVLDPTTREVSIVNARAGIEVGSNVGKTGPFADAVRDAYASALARAPRVDVVAPGVRFRTPWRFAMRRGRMDDKRVGDGAITIDRTEAVAGPVRP